MSQINSILRYAKSPSFRCTLVFVITFATVWYPFSPNLWNRWATVDDHEIAWMLGSDQFLKITEIVPAIVATEVGKPGRASRFRPGYFTTRTMEAFLWGARPGIWYASRLFMLTVFFGGIYLMLYSLVGFIIGYLFLLWLLSYPLWDDIWSRLGPGEAYCCFGLGLYFIALVILRAPAQKPRWERFAWLVFLAANFFLAGSKENWSILIFPNLLFAIFLWSQRRLHLLAVASIGISCLFDGAVAVISWLGVRSAGHVYGEQVAAATLTQLAAEGMQKLYEALYWQGVVFGVLFLAYVLALLLPRREPPALTGRALVWHGASFLTIGALFVWNHVFYHGDWIWMPRYRFPGQFLSPTAWVLVASLLLVLLRHFFGSNLKVQLLAFALAFFVAYDHIFIQQLVEFHTKGNRRIELTRTFTHQIQKTTAYFSHHPGVQLVIDTYGHPTDYEIVLSLRRFLTLYGLDRPIFLRLHPFEGGPQPEAFAKLQDELATLSETGRLRPGWSGFRPLSEFDPAKPCASLTIREAPHGNCSNRGNYEAIF